MYYEDDGGYRDDEDRPASMTTMMAATSGPGVATRLTWWTCGTTLSPSAGRWHPVAGLTGLPPL